MNEMTVPSRHRIQNSSLAVWGRTRYLSVTEAPHTIESLRVSLFETWMPERWSNPRSPTFKAGSFNHCTRAPAWHDRINQQHFVATELKDPIWHSLEWQIGSFSSEATISAAGKKLTLYFCRKSSEPGHTRLRCVFLSSLEFGSFRIM